MKLSTNKINWHQCFYSLLLVDFYRSRRLNQDFCSAISNLPLLKDSLNQWRRNESYTARLLKVEVKFFQQCQQKASSHKLCSVEVNFYVFLLVLTTVGNGCQLVPSLPKKRVIGVLIIIALYWLVFFSL